jgi:hypothetical protein
MSGFIRRYLQDPGLAELLAIEGVVIIDREPAASVIGTGSGTVCLVAEFENGDYQPLEVMGGQDVLTQYGAFGFVYDGVGGNYPCARARQADSALVPEYWNGNGYVALTGKSFSRLILTRVDTSVGEVSLSRLPYLLGNDNSTWTLLAGAALGLHVDGAAAAVATFTAATARVVGAGSYPTTFAGGETMVVRVDAGTDLEVAETTITFTDADETQAQVISRINTALGYTAASVTASNETTLQGRVQGTSGHVQILSLTAAVGTKTGFSVSSVAGSGNVANIAGVTYAEVVAIVEAAVPTTMVGRNADGALLVASKTTTLPSSIAVDSTTTTTTAFGFVQDSVVTSASIGVAGTLSAGILVSTASGTQKWVTVVDVAVQAGTAGPYKVRIRPAVDDGTNTGALPAAITQIESTPANMGLWAVTNVLAALPALTEAQLDAAYSDAIDRTRNPNSVARQANIIVSARQSNAIRYKLRSNALEASSNGLFGRMGIVRPPLGTTTRAQARSASTQPGVGAYRDQRVAYAFPGGSVYVPAIAKVGLAGGAGFTADGIVDVGSDTWLAAVMSQLPPEENPGQLTNYAANLLGIERGNPDVQSMTIEDYKAFRAAGIAALRIDNGVAIFQSGVTSVDPTMFPALKNIARRRMSDFIQDSLAAALRSYTKKLAGQTRRGLVIGTIDGFLYGLQSLKNTSAQRIDSWSTDYKSGNTGDTIAAGLFRAIIKVRTLSSMDVIVLDTEIGEGVLTIKQAA